ncbi:hypothetical protein EC973_000371 [Apophysomyces ossiformis]|uniref:Uncharacterized protein n=1 Tax=Apophysomyces ossiformis TaxID=679940 RepID=A0A8H7BL21_9FUNG|nr:hypothetical protein EC973_000371 [Apophysomyces ossiformis]
MAELRRIAIIDCDAILSGKEVQIEESIQKNRIAGYLGQLLQGKLSPNPASSNGVGTGNGTNNLPNGILSPEVEVPSQVKTSPYGNMATNWEGPSYAEQQFANFMSQFVFKNFKVKWITKLNRLPEDDDLDLYGAYLFYGSQMEGEYDPIRDFAKRVYDKAPEAKLIGIGSGHIIIANAFGLKVEPNEKQKKLDILDGFLTNHFEADFGRHPHSILLMMSTEKRIGRVTENQAGLYPVIYDEQYDTTYAVSDGKRILSFQVAVDPPSQLLHAVAKTDARFKARLTNTRLESDYVWLLMVIGKFMMNPSLRLSRI